MEHTVHKLKSSNSRLEIKHRNAAEEHQTDLVRLEKNLEKLTSDKVDLSNKLSSAAKKLEINEKTQHRLEASRALAESLCTEYRGVYFLPYNVTKQFLTTIFVYYPDPDAHFLK